MSIPARLGLVLVPLSFLAVLLLGGLAAAGDEKTQETWTYERNGDRREVQVTHMSPELRAAVDAQLEAKGWKRVSAGVEVEDEEGVPPREEVTPKGDPKKLAESTKRDIEELIAGGGRLPEGFKPHALGAGAPPPDTGALAGMARAAGRVMLRYLEVKEDPVRAPIYEKVLAEVGKVLVGLDADAPADLRQVGMRLLGSFMQGMNDPKTAPVYREIMDLVTKEMLTVAAPPVALRPRVGRREPVPPDRPPTVSGLRGFVTPTFVGGAHLKTVPLLDRDLVSGQRVLGVEPGSVAHEMGLRGGDLIYTVNGKPADLRGVEAIRKALGQPGKLSIEVKRRDGKIEVLDIEFEAAEPAGGAGSK